MDDYNTFTARGEIMVNSKTEANSSGDYELPSIEKKAILKNLFVVLFAAVTTSSAFAQINTTLPKSPSGNLTNGSSEHVWSNGTGELCWRSSFWTPATAGSKCDGGIVPQYSPSSSLLITSKKVTYQGDALFDFDKATLKPEGKSKLNDLILKAKNSNSEAFIVTGYTDKVGTETYNNDLSKRRAESVKRYLIAKGLDAHKIFVEAKGKNQPITKGCVQLKNGKASEDKEYIKCLSPDRRVVIDLITSRNK